MDDQKPVALNGILKHVPLGSLAVDATLILYMVYAFGQMTQTLSDISHRLERVEVVTATEVPNSDARLRVVEAANQTQDRDLADLKRDILARLDRIEQKVDRVRR